MSDEPAEATATVTLDGDEALVLFEVLSRWFGSPSLGQRQTFSGFDHPSEERVLFYSMLPQLQKILVSPLRSDYAAMLDAARKRVEARW